GQRSGPARRIVSGAARLWLIDVIGKLAGCVVPVTVDATGRRIVSDAWNRGVLARRWFSPALVLQHVRAVDFQHRRRVTGGDPVPTWPDGSRRQTLPPNSPKERNR
ncbi:MAG: hypothetical protein ACOC5E_01055, partial [Acidobacteriota bacterium]